MSINKPIQLGLCCLNITLRNSKPSVFCSRGMIQRTINEPGGIEILKSKIIENCKDLIKMIEWNEQNGIKVFRISSSLFSHKTNPNIPNYDMEFAKDLLRTAGDLAKQYNQRITMHPGQYNVVGTPHEKCFKQTILDLEYQCTILDYMGMGVNSVMVVHGGGIYGDKEATKKRWCKQFYELPENVQKRLVLENCEKCFSIQDCLDISKQINIPVVLDTHHYNCYKLLHPEENIKNIKDYIPDILNTWIIRNIKPKFHVSEQGIGRCGHHSDYIDIIPDYLTEIPEIYDIHIDIMIEAKKKELAIFKLYQKYTFLQCKIKKTKKIKIIKKNKKIILIKKNKKIFLIKK